MARGEEVQKIVRGGLAAWQVEHALRLLLADLSVDFPIAELASRCGLSRSYFSKAFRISLGTSPHRWLMRERVRRAGEMLERTEENISAIALACGFSDQSHFTRIFHATVGSSPAAWRRQRRAGIAPPFASSARWGTLTGAHP